MRSLSFKASTQPLLDILEGIRLIEEFTVGITFEQFEADPKTIAAVERKLLTIGEAAVRVGREAPQIAPDVPWRSVRDMANFLRHEYDRVDLIVIWRTVKENLAPLKASVSNALSRLQNS